MGPYHAIITQQISFRYPFVHDFLPAQNCGLRLDREFQPGAFVQHLISTVNWGCFSITTQASLNDIQWIGLRLQESMVFTFYHQIYVMYNIAIYKGFLQIFSFPILNII